MDATWRITDGAGKYVVGLSESRRVILSSHKPRSLKFTTSQAADRWLEQNVAKGSGLPYAEVRPEYKPGRKATVRRPGAKEAGMVKSMRVGDIVRVHARELDAWQKLALKYANQNDVTRIRVAGGKVEFLDDVKE